MRLQPYSFQGKTPWVDQSCADCPGFLAPGCWRRPTSRASSRSLRVCPWPRNCLMALRANSWICCPQLPYHPSKNGTHSTCFCHTGVGNEKSARSFSDRSFFEPPCGHGRPCLRVMDVGTEVLAFFQDFEGLTQVLPPDVCRDIRVDVRRISGPKTYSLGRFFLPEFRLIVEVCAEKA